MATKVEFKRVQTDAEVENIDIKDGQLIYTGTGKTYMDYGTERIPTGSGGSSVTVDTEMSDTSTNAVQNKVIKEYVDSQTVPEEVIVSDTQPTGDDWKLWIDSDKQTDNTYYNDNGTPTNIKTTTFDTLPVGAELDYDGSVVPDGWTEVDDYSAFEVTKDDTYVQNIINSSYKYGKLVNLNLNIQPKDATMGTGAYKLASGAPAPLNGFEFFAGEYTSYGNTLQRLFIDENGDIYWWYNNQFENTSGWRIAVNLVYLTTD